jgi:Lrp/AsnC family transcriptional regulator
MTKSAAAAHLDAFDLRIISVLQADASLTHGEIGRRVRLSASSVRRRIEVLKKRGAIRGIVAIIDPHLAMGAVTVIVHVAFERETHGGYAAFKQRVGSETFVVQCHIVSGQIDAVLVVIAPTLEEYWAWAERTLAADPMVRRFDSNFVLSTLKQLGAGS